MITKEAESVTIVDVARAAGVSYGDGLAGAQQ